MQNCGDPNKCKIADILVPTTNDITFAQQCSSKLPNHLARCKYPLSALQPDVARAVGACFDKRGEQQIVDCQDTTGKLFGY